MKKLKSLTKTLQKARLSNTSFIPKEVLYKLILGKIRKYSSYFITQQDLRSINLIGNVSLIGIIPLFILFYYLTNRNIIIAVALSVAMIIAFLFVSGDHIRSKILIRRQEFDEIAFLIINSLSINMLSTQSFPMSVELLTNESIDNEHYQKYFQEILYKSNLGENEDTIIQDGGKMFLSDRYRHIFQNIKREQTFIDSDPEFLLRVKRQAALIEDNIVIFIAVTCLLPLVLSLVLALIVPQDSLSILLLPLIYALFGSYILRYIQNKNFGVQNG